jgi:hypothetical protein
MPTRVGKEDLLRPWGHLLRAGSHQGEISKSYNEKKMSTTPCTLVCAQQFGQHQMKFLMYYLKDHEEIVLPQSTSYVNDTTLTMTFSVIWYFMSLW